MIFVNFTEYIKLFMKKDIEIENMTSNYVKNYASFKDLNGNKKRENSLKYTDSIFSHNIFPSNEINFKDINFITKVFYCVLYVFSNQSHSKLHALIGRLLENITTIILTYVILSDLYDLYTIFYLIPMGVTFSSLVTDFCGFSVRIILLYKKTSMMSTMKFIEESYANLMRKSIRRRRVKLSIAFAACFIIPTVEYIYVGMSCYELGEFYMQSLFFGWKPENNNFACILILIIDTITLNQQYALPGFAIVLCCYVFGVLRRFVDKLSSELSKQTDIQNIMNLYVKYSRIIYVCVEKIEDAFSVLLVFLYGYMICSIFNTVTSLITLDYNRVQIIETIPYYVIIFTVLPAFFIMSLRATAINDAAKRVKKTIYELIAKIDSSDHNLKNLVLTLADDFPVRVVVTGWGLFAIKRNFIQGTAGVMITYSILLSQLGS